jgi:hypothetical protein
MELLLLTSLPSEQVLKLSLIASCLDLQASNDQEVEEDSSEYPSTSTLKMGCTYRKSALQHGIQPARCPAALFAPNITFDSALCIHQRALISLDQFSLSSLLASIMPTDVSRRYAKRIALPPVRPSAARWQTPMESEPSVPAEVKTHMHHSFKQCMSGSLSTIN